MEGNSVFFLGGDNSKFHNKTSFVVHVVCIFIIKSYTKYNKSLKLKSHARKMRDYKLHIILKTWQIYPEWTISNKNLLKQYACCFYSARATFCGLSIVIYYYYYSYVMYVGHKLIPKVKRSFALTFLFYVIMVEFKNNETFESTRICKTCTTQNWATSKD